MNSLAQRHDAAGQTLVSIGQDHLLHFYDQLDEAQCDKLLRDIEAIDWPQIAALIQTHVKTKPQFAMPVNLEPAEYYPYQPTAEHESKYRAARQRGEALAAAGKVAVFTVAGGQGTRLGWDGPKGTFPATAITKMTLFECQARAIGKVQQKYGAAVPWYIMTSTVNDADTRAFLQQHNYFGLDADNVMLFSQAMMPALDMHSGKALLDSPCRLALSPNGHGGSLKALYADGEHSALSDMQRRGIEQISYIQIDNPIVRVVDPLFIGLHDLDDAQMSSKMLPKAYPEEKLGVFCNVDGRVVVIEYSDLPKEVAAERGDNGELRFGAGSIALHVIRVDFVASLNEAASGFALPFHRAEKKVPYVDPVTGARVNPDDNNAVKLEMFVFDALPLCDRSAIYETDRLEDFAPIKNRNEDKTDCPATSIQAQSQRNACWLESHGVQIPRNATGQVDAVIEIRPQTALEPADLADVQLPASIDRGATVLL